MSFIKRSVFSSKPAQQQTQSDFEKGLQSAIDIPIYVLIGIKQKDRYYIQELL